jgi:uncharacterized protein (DUF608 family)
VAALEGLPRFRNCTFTGEFPFANLKFNDPTIPLHVTLRAWNPFIPLDDKASGIPCAILDYTLHNPTTHPVDF